MLFKRSLVERILNGEIVRYKKFSFAVREFDSHNYVTIVDNENGKFERIAFNKEGTNKGSYRRLLKAIGLWRR